MCARVHLRVGRRHLYQGCRVLQRSMPGQRGRRRRPVHHLFGRLHAGWRALRGGQQLLYARLRRSRLGRHRLSGRHRLPPDRRPLRLQSAVLRRWHQPQRERDVRRRPVRQRLFSLSAGREHLRRRRVARWRNDQRSAKLLRRDDAGLQARLDRHSALLRRRRRPLSQGLHRRLAVLHRRGKHLSVQGSVLRFDSVRARLAWRSPLFCGRVPALRGSLHLGRRLLRRIGLRELPLRGRRSFFRGPGLLSHRRLLHRAQLPGKQLPPLHDGNRLHLRRSLDAPLLQRLGFGSRLAPEVLTFFGGVAWAVARGRRGIR